MDRHATPVSRGVPTLLCINSVVSALESALLMVPALPERPADRGGGLWGSLPARISENARSVWMPFSWSGAQEIGRSPPRSRCATALGSRLSSDRFRFVADSGMRAAGSGGLRCGSGAGEFGLAGNSLARPGPTVKSRGRGASASRRWTCDLVG